MKFTPFSIGKYEFIEVLGRGGMAEVYRVRTTGEQGFEKEFAIKRILHGSQRSNEANRLFEAEAKLTSILNHANIVHVFDFIKSGDDHFLVMEFIQGKNLGVIIKALYKKQLRIPEEIALYIITEVCKGLDYAHNKRDPKSSESLNIIHRDISPQNIMLSYEGSIKIVDFGIAKVMMDGQGTHSGRIAGKLSYMSPEQAWGRPADARSDLFSLSAVLFELLLAKPLFNEKKEAAQLRAVQDCLLPNLKTDLAKLPAALGKVIQIGINPIPDLRFQTAAEMRIPLTKYMNEHYPSMDQRQLAEWLNKHQLLKDSPVKLSEVDVTPMTPNEKQEMEKELSKIR